MNDAPFNTYFTTERFNEISIASTEVNPQDATGRSDKRDREVTQGAQAADVGFNSDKGSHHGIEVGSKVFEESLVAKRSVGGAEARDAGHGR